MSLNELVTKITVAIQHASFGLGQQPKLGYLSSRTSQHSIDVSFGMRCMACAQVSSRFFHTCEEDEGVISRASSFLVRLHISM